MIAKVHCLCPSVIEGLVIEAELSRLKRDIAEARMARPIYKKPPRALRRRSCPVRVHGNAASPVSPGAIVSDP